MNAQPSKPAAIGLHVGASFYQVLEPSSLLGPGGSQQYAMFGPFATLMEASAFSMTKPGSFVTVTLIQHQSPAAKPAASSLVKSGK